jgi:hypothetical protein
MAHGLLDVVLHHIDGCAQAIRNVSLWHLITTRANRALRPHASAAPSPETLAKLQSNSGAIGTPATMIYPDPVSGDEIGIIVDGHRTAAVRNSYIESRSKSF